MRKSSLIFIFILVVLTIAIFIGFQKRKEEKPPHIFPPQRIISTMPSNTEILFALGLESQIVGVTDQCNYPPQAKNIEKIGGIPLNIEKIVAMEPDLIVMLGDAQRPEITRLEKLDQSVFIVNPRTLDEVLESILDIGKATGKDREARELVKEMEDKIEKAKEIITSSEIKSPKVLVEIWHERLTAAGKGTFIDDLLRNMKAVNIAGLINFPYAKFSMEKLIEESPDAIIIPKSNEKYFVEVYTNPSWEVIPAIASRKVLVIEDDLIFRPGPRLADAFEIIAQFLYTYEHEE